jgi:hypothetical protein
MTTKSKGRQMVRHCIPRYPIRLTSLIRKPFGRHLIVLLLLGAALGGCAGTMAKFAAGQGWSDNPPSQQKR